MMRRIQQSTSEHWKDWDFRKLMKMMTEENMAYFDGEENPTANIKTLVELVLRDAEGRQTLMKKLSINNQVLVLRLAREVVMRHAHTHHRGVSGTLKEIKRRCYWPNCVLDVAQIVHQSSIYLE